MLTARGRIRVKVCPLCAALVVRDGVERSSTPRTFAALSASGTADHSERPPARLESARCP